MSNEELKGLISEYNEQETAQRERLLSIWREMKARGGGDTFIQFGIGHAWRSNAFDKNIDERFSIPAHVDSMSAFITDYHI